MPNENFQSTHWSVVKAVGLGDTNGRIALENLYLSYRAPLLAFVRSKGYSKEDSEDIVQGLFESLVNLNSWRLASPDRGRFRSFLLGAVKHFIANQYKRNNASKRGGNFSFVSWEELPESVSEGILASSEDSPEKLYDRVWGTVILEKAKSRLKETYRLRGRERVFEALECFLWGRKREISYSEVAHQLGIVEGAVKSEVSRLRSRLEVEFHKSLRFEVAQTVSEPDLVDDELRKLMDVFAEGR